MAEKVTRKDILEYRTLAKMDGREVSQLTDAQIIQQILILRGGLSRPPPSEIDEILARAKKTEKLFQACRKGVLQELEKALKDFRAMDRRPPARPGNDPSSLARRAKRVVALQRRLLAHPPSMLDLEHQNALRLVDDWAVEAARVLGEKSPGKGRALLQLTDRLASVIESLKMASP